MSERTIEAAGEWLVSLCNVEGSINNRDQLLTPLEQLKLDEFFSLHGQSPIFKRHHVEAIRRCMSRDIRPEYQLARALLERDDTCRLFEDENDILQVAIKRANMEPELLGKSPLKSNPELMKMVKLLLAHGAGVNCLDGDGYSPLYYTCVLGYADLFHFLIASGANISTVQKRNVPEQVKKLRETMDDKSFHDKEETVNLLGATLDALISPQNVTNMTWVGWPPGVNFDRPLWEMDIDLTWGGIILYLLQQGLSFAKDDLGLVMLLHIACYQGSQEFVEKLLDSGIKADIPGPRIVDGGQGEGSACGTAMHAAAADRKLDIIKTLIARGENAGLRRLCIFNRGSVNAQMAPVEIAIATGQYEDDENLQDFLEGFINVADNLEESDLEAVLNWCVASNVLDLAQNLLQRGVRLDEIPLGVNRVDMAQLLITHGIKLNVEALQKEALRKNLLDLLRWWVDGYGPLLPQDKASWGKMAFRLVEGRLSNMKTIEYLIYEYPGPHIDTVFVSPSRNLKYSEDDETTIDASWLYLAIMKCNMRATRLLLEAGADPNCPGLPVDAAAAMKRVDQHGLREVSERLEVIKMIQERLSEDGKWNVPSLAETRFHAGDVIATERKAWDKKVRCLVKNRQEVPEVLPSGRRATLPLPATSIASPTDLYKPLASTSSFRLLELLPSNKMLDGLVGRLVDSDITLQPKYEALSYVWGDTSPAKYISLDDKDIAITPNLHSALTHIRSADSVRTIWVDALCINQSFHDERNQQVRIMGDIYKSAKQVIVWLGDAADDSHLVFEHLEDDNIEESSPNYPEQLEAKRKAWKALVNRPWFFRTWVIQEIALARRALIMCGKDTTLWRNIEASWKDDFSNGAKGLSTVRTYPGNQLDHPISGFDPDKHVWRLRLLKAESDPVSILRYSRVCGTTEVRDKIYGILGLFKPGFVEVDYDLPVESIFQQFAEAVIQLTGDLNILKYAGESPKYENLPSWVPDFTEISTRSLLGDSWYPPWRADAPSQYEIRFVDGKNISIPREDLTKKYLPGLSFLADRSLVIKGKMVDTIRSVSVELPSGTSHAPGTEAFGLVMKEWETLATTLIPEWESSDSSVSSAFAATISATSGYQIFSVDIGFTQWYRHCGTGVLEEADPSMFLRDHEFYLWWCDVGKPDDPDDEEYEGLGYHIREFADEMMAASYGRCLFTTENGSMGLASSQVEAGDRIVYFPGSSEPFALRKREDGRGWTLVGDCYLYGLDIDELFHDKEHLGEDFSIY
ncbi:hypothetical protein FPOAC2_02621 [Fusarium poae]|uniref:Heterokaryon incompatibility domain-containing protein n=1 Tax=Fusarium poae TaxID=36050 RepID=A0A1B8B6U0_FUSPO|nr:hypothetical protein FPOAC1_002508 [Fusarium poae]KAG8676504.1 hypothetical protein FPOAC1_002508 [Fusarium poae]OBS28450.1 hypothetical protein FPOA_02388 [Fusarium poae]